MPSDIRRLRAVFVTALEVEYKAVLAHLHDVQEETHKGTVYEVGTLIAGTRSWRVAVVEAGAGNEAAALEAERAIDHFNAQVAMFVGVAGGIKDVGLGDVVAATKIYGYLAGKADDPSQGFTSDADPGFRARPEIGRSTHALEQRARAERRSGRWTERILRGHDAGASTPQATVAPIAAGPRVVASTRSSTYNLIREHYSDAVAVEMEGRGFLEAAFRNHQVEALVVRGISDLLDQKNNSDEDVRQRVASENAAAFAFEVLANFDPAGGPGPAAMPRTENRRPRRNPNFVGRGDVLDILRTPRDDDPGPSVYALHGLPGVGKTRAVLEYLHRTAGDHQLVWWIEAGDPASIEFGLLALAHALHLPGTESAGHPASADTLLQSLGQYLESHAGWVLIFDGADSPRDIAPYLPESGPGIVLITSHNPNWREVAAVPIHVVELTEEESCTFLTRRTGEPPDGAAELAQLLGCFPLALEQAGAYIESTRCGFDGYTAIYQRERTSLFEVGGPPTDYPETVATTWLVALKRVREQHPPAADLLNLLAFFGPEAIPMSMLHRAANALPEELENAVASQVSFDRMVAILRRYSLVDADGDSISIHRLVQAVTRDRMAEQDARAWCDCALDVSGNQFPMLSHDIEEWYLIPELLAHALTAAEYAIELDLDPKAIAGLLVATGLSLTARGDPRQAEPIMRRALEIEERTFGERHYRVASVLANLSLILLDLDRLDEATKAAKTALDIDIQAFGPSSREVARDKGRLASTFLSIGNLDAARTAAQEALEIVETIEQPDSFGLLTDVNNLGAVLAEIRDLDGARRLFERALELARSIHGPDHPTAARAANNLGSVMHEAGDVVGALEMYRRAVCVAERAYSDRHPVVAGYVNNVAAALDDLGDHRAAVAEYQRALSIDEEAFGAYHSRVAQDLNNLGIALHRLGMDEAALAHHQRALAIERVLPGEGRPSLAVRLNNLAVALQQLARYEDVKELLLEALRVTERHYGPNHPQVATCLTNLATELRRGGNLDDAQAMVERARDIDVGTFGHDHPAVARDIAALAVLEYDRSRYEAAYKGLSEAASILADFGDGQVRELVRTELQLGHTAKALGNQRVAARHYRHALDLSIDAFGLEHALTSEAWMAWSKC